MKMGKTLLVVVPLMMMLISISACGEGAAPDGATQSSGAESGPEPTAPANMPESPAAAEADASEPPAVADAPESPASAEVDVTEPSASDIEVPQDFVLIEGGTFEMGSPDSEPWREDDETQHGVTVSDFYMSIYEVTQEEYQAMMGNNPSTFSGEDLPVENITWYDAVAYCNARSEAEGLTPVYAINGQNVTWDRSANGYRLPTEAEWEYACRAGTTTPFNTETSIGADEANYYGRYPYEIENNYFSQGDLETQPGEYRETTVPVGSFEPNSFGLYDMHGNVREWCWDYYGEYSTEPQSDPTGPASGSLRMNRGGGWDDYAKHLRSAYRAAIPPTNAGSDLGLRLALGATATSEAVTGAADREEPESGGGETLIVYFSWSGNTRGIAHQIQEMTGADIFEIELVSPYSSDYNTVLEQAQRDQNRQARPELADHVENMEQYDTILLGYPNWWASIPMPVASFLEGYDFSGKTILPFCSHGGGRFGQSLSAIAKLVPDATMTEGLSVHYSGGPDLPDRISAWLNQNGITDS